MAEQSSRRDDWPSEMKAPEPDGQASRIPKTGIARRLGPSTTPVDLIVDSNEYADLRDEVKRLTDERDAALAERDEYKALALASEGVLVDAPALAVRERERADAALAEAAALRAAIVDRLDGGGDWQCAICLAWSAESREAVVHEPGCAFLAQTAEQRQAAG